MFVIILALAWPTMLEQFMQTAVQYQATAMMVLGPDSYAVPDPIPQPSLESILTALAAAALAYRQIKHRVSYAGLGNTVLFTGKPFWRSMRLLFFF